VIPPRLGARPAVECWSVMQKRLISAFILIAYSAILIKLLVFKTIQLRGRANRSRSASGSGLPAVTGPGFSDEPPKCGNSPDRHLPVCGGAAGSCTVTQSPPAVRGVRVRIPLCAWVMLLTIARPRPTPA
jgi:hypothetical protein